MPFETYTGYAECLGITYSARYLRLRSGNLLGNRLAAVALKFFNSVAMPTFLRDLIRPAAELPEADVCLVGLPLDFGTVLEGGRAGAVGAPDAIRRELRRYHKTYNLEHDISLDDLRIADAGNLELRHPDHAPNHAHIRERLGQLLRAYPRVVVLGGSHDGTYSTVRGLFDASGGQAVGRHQP